MKNRNTDHNKDGRRLRVDLQSLRSEARWRCKWNKCQDLELLSKMKFSGIQRPWHEKDSTIEWHGGRPSRGKTLQSRCPHFLGHSPRWNDKADGELKVENERTKDHQIIHHHKLVLKDSLNYNTQYRGKMSFWCRNRTKKVTGFFFFFVMTYIIAFLFVRQRTSN